MLRVGFRYLCANRDSTGENFRILDDDNFGPWISSMADRISSEPFDEIHMVQTKTDFLNDKTDFFRRNRFFCETRNTAKQIIFRSYFSANLVVFLFAQTQNFSTIHTIWSRWLFGDARASLATSEDQHRSLQRLSLKNSISLKVISDI